jgi:hypothetical protein
MLKMGYFMWSEWDVPRQIKAKLAAEPLYISSIVLLSCPSSLSITVSMFLYNSYNSKLFSTTINYYLLSKIARATTTRQIANLAARNTRNSTASTTAAAALR